MRKIASLIVMLMLFQVLAFSQDRTITGVVKDEAGLVVPGASIRIKGTKVGTAADNQGHFRIQAKSGDILLITAAGIDPAELTVGSSDAVAITVKNKIATGSEVVVTALGIKRQDKALGYGVSKVDPNSLLQRSEPNALAGLAGKVPGVDIRGGQGAPGAAVRIQIRGVSSFNGGEPLIVVDGIPYSNNLVNTSNPFNGGGTYGSGFGDLDPNDIETINILKGAAAAALYGSRAANGVIMITTKKANKGLGITINSAVTVGNIDKSTFAKYQNEYGAGYSSTYQKDGFFYFDANGDGVKDYVTPTSEDASYGAKFDPSLMVYQWDSFDPTSPTYKKATPWVAAAHTPVDFYETAVSTNNNIMLSGSNDKGLLN